MARSQLFVLITSLIFSLMSCYALATPQTSFGLHIAKIQKLTGQTGQLDQDQKIYKITIPRDDLKILMSGMPMSPDTGLASWVTFKKTNNQTSVNGDLILLQDQINPVMSVALRNGLQVTGLHNPYLWDSPRVMFMHIIGEGDELQLASAIGQVLKKIKTTSNGEGDFPLGNFGLPRTTLSAHKIDVILGQTGQFKDDVYKVEFSAGIKATATEASKVIALNTWAAFAGSDNEAVVNGTMVLHQSELQKALVKLRNAQIYILAIYHPMVNDNQDLVLINFWGVGNTQALAKALRSAYVIAQNNNPSNTTAGEILPDISASSARIAREMNPIQLSLYKKDNCGYVKAKELYTSIDTIQNSDGDYAKQLSVALRIALNLTQKIVLEKMTEFVSFLPTTLQMIQTTGKNAQVLPSARNLLLKLSVVSNNVPEFVKLLALGPIITPVGSAEEITVAGSTQVSSTSVSPLFTQAISTAVMQVYANINKFAISSVSVFKSLVHAASVAVVRDINALTALAVNASQAVDYAAFVAMARVNTHINEFAMLSVDMSKSFANVASVAVAYMYASMTEFAVFSVNVSKVLTHATSFVSLKTIDFTHAYAAEFVTSLAQSFSLVRNTVIQLAQSSAKKTVTLLIAMKKPVPSAVNLTAQNKMQLLLQPLSIPANASIESMLKTRLTLFSPPLILATLPPAAAKNSLADALTTTLAFVEKNTAEEMAQSLDKPSVVVAESAAKNKIPSMLKPLIKILSPMLLPPLALPVSASTVQVAQKKEIDVVKPVENTLDHIVQVIPKTGPSISSVTEAKISQPEKTLVKVPPAPDQSHNRIVKSLSAALPVSQHKVITAPTAKIVPTSLSMPQHKVIRVATLSPLPYPQSRKNHPVAKVKLLTKPLASLRQTQATQYREQPNKVKIHTVAQHKNRKLAQLSASPLLHAQSISKHNISRIKPVTKAATSFAHTKTVKHGEQLNKKLFVTLPTAYHKHANSAPNRAAIYPVVHNISHQPVRKIAEKSRRTPHTRLHEEDWNTEKLVPEPPIRVAHQQVYRAQEEFDDGSTLVGAYPYDEEPAEGGFGA